MPDLIPVTVADLAAAASGGSRPPGARPVAEVTITVHGTPAPQGSKRGFVVGKRAIVVDDNKPRLRTWRQDVKDAALAQWATMLHGPVEVYVAFWLPRPKGHYGTGRNAGRLRPGSLTEKPAKKPDLDKLLRSTFDGLKEAGIYKDDAQVIIVQATKQYCPAGQPPGAHVHVREVWEQEP